MLVGFRYATALFVMSAILSVSRIGPSYSTSARLSGGELGEAEMEALT